MNVGLVYSENEAWDYPAPHLTNGFPLKAFLPSFPPHGSAGLQGKPMWGAGGRCSTNPPALTLSQGNFVSVAPVTQCRNY